MGKRENKVETYLDSEVCKRGGLTRKWASPGHVGVLDRVVVLDGLVVFVEVKTADGGLSSQQKREIERFQRAGAIARVVYGKKQVDALMIEMERLLDERRR